MLTLQYKGAADATIRSFTNGIAMRDATIDEAERPA